MNSRFPAHPYALVGTKGEDIGWRTGFGRVVTNAESYLPLSINSVEASSNNDDSRIEKMRVAIKSAFIFKFVLF
jgi:hypothetical protein